MKVNNCGAVLLGQNVYVGKYCALGCPKEARIRNQAESGASLVQGMDPVEISDNCIIGNHVCIYEGTKISAGTFIDDNVRIGYNCVIGRNVRIMYGSFICDRVVIHDNVRVGGFVCDGAHIGENSTVMGNLVHEYSKPHRGWWDVDEVSPVIERDVVVGFNALIIGGVTIGPQVYVAAGAVVTKSVPPQHIVVGVNQCIPLKEWKGQKLKELITYWTSSSTTPRPD